MTLRSSGSGFFVAKKLRHVVNVESESDDGLTLPSRCLRMASDIVDDGDGLDDVKLVPAGCFVADAFAP